MYYHSPLYHQCKDHKDRKHIICDHAEAVGGAESEEHDVREFRTANGFKGEIL